MDATRTPPHVMMRGAASADRGASASGPATTWSSSAVGVGFAATAARTAAASASQPPASSQLSASATASQQSQPEMLTQNPDLTQPFGDFLDDEDGDEIDDLFEDEYDDDEGDDDDEGVGSPYLDASQELGGSASARRKRRRRRKRRLPPPPMPWGRLVPCGGGSESSSGELPQPPIDLMPRLPSAPPGGEPQVVTTTATAPAVVAVAGPPPRPGDVFNEYVLGRSAKCDVVVRRRNLRTQGGDRCKNGNDGDASVASSSDNKLSEWVYSLVSNKHARIYCLQVSAAAPSLQLGDSRGYEVYVEDTSNNGTVVNGTVLRRCERRILNSGDEVCLVNPQLVRKKVRSKVMLQQIAQEYSYVFVAQQLLPQPLRMTGVFAAAIRGATEAYPPASEPFQSVVPLPPPQPQHPMFSNLKPAVDPRAMKTHSFVPPAPRRQDVKPAPSTGLDASSGRSGRPRAHGPVEEVISSQPDRPTAAAASFLPPPASWNHDSQRSQAQQPNLRRISPRRQPTRRVEEDYDIRDLLGSGTTGEVRRAIERRTGIQRAVKIIPIRQTLGGFTHAADATAALLTAEANLLRQLDHPYIVSLVDVYASPSAVCLVMELVHGGELFDRIVQKGRYSEVDSRRVMRRILSAMHYLHEERHVVHRDLKPENILLRSRESDVEITITDFGLAKAVAGGDGLKTFCGTATYCAPEILQRRNTFMGRGRYNKQADQWSLGVILYILLSGCQPFDGDQWMASGAPSPPPGSQSSEDFLVFPDEFWTGVSELARDLVRRMLVVDPKKRITVREACNHPWVLIDDGDTHRHPLDDPRFPRESSKTVPQPDGKGRAAHVSLMSTQVSSLQNSSSLNRTPRAVQAVLGATSAVEVEPKASEDDLDSVPIGEPHKAPPTAERLAKRSNHELSDDEIFSQFSDKTDSVGSFDTCGTSTLLSESTGNGKGEPVVDSADKENASATAKASRKRRVTTSVSSSTIKSPKDRKATPRRSHASQLQKRPRRKSVPTEPAQQTQKQKKLSAWFKHK